MWRFLEGKEACATKDAATVFDESWYDKTYDQLMTLIKANTKSDFVYLKYTYQQLLFETRRIIGGYNGYTIETAKQTISRNKN